MGKNDPLIGMIQALGGYAEENHIYVTDRYML